MAPNSGASSAQARLREALAAGGPGTKDKGPPVADGTLSVTPDTPEAIEFRTRRSTFDSVGASSSYLEDETGPKPSELYGKFTWKIENFSDVQKRELRSNVFEVGSYKWYILVYPQGCDVSNHLSLFLCVADYDKLLPGWSHFAQFTIAVVNKDPKKSKYSDTLHRFCKKEHDWGWKKFMELNKVLEGFTVNNTLLIKAQVQVIRDRPHAPFRCLDAQYRRELVRVYLTNVETICRKFVDEKRAEFVKLRGDVNGFHSFLASLDVKRRKVLAFEKGETVLKAIVKRFFNEKEVTSTLVMDALFSGCKQLEDAGRQSESKKAKKERPGAVILAEKNIFSLIGDTNGLLERVVSETIPQSQHDKSGDQLSLRNAQDADEYSKDYVDRDESRLADLGRKAIEVLAISLIFKELQVAHNEALSLKLQDQLIREEEEAERRLDERQASRIAAEREKKARKKERRRAKKIEEEAQNSEQNKQDDAASASTRPTQSSFKAQEKSKQAATAGNERLSDCTPLGTRSSSLEENSEQTSNNCINQDGPSTHAESRGGSDDEASSTSRSASEERPLISSRQYEDHIEYLKSELTRVVSHLNKARAEVEESKENLSQAHNTIATLQTRLADSSSRASDSSKPRKNVDNKSPCQALLNLQHVQHNASRFENHSLSEMSEATSSDPTTDPKIELPASHRQNSAISAPDGVAPGRTQSNRPRNPWNGVPNSQEQEANVIVQQPPPPPPSESRQNGSGNGATSHRGSSGRSVQNGKRQNEAQTVRKASNQLNGNATAFVPSGNIANGGNHMISYRNVAAGLVSTPSTGDLPEAPRLPQVAAVQAMDASSQKNGGASSPSETPRSDLGTTSLTTSTTVAPLILSSSPALGAIGATFSPKHSGLQQTTAFTATPNKKVDSSRGMESPGLDDFAHMGLITDLLE